MSEYIHTNMHARTHASIAGMHVHTPAHLHTYIYTYMPVECMLVLNSRICMNSYMLHVLP